MRSDSRGGRILIGGLAGRYSGWGAVGMVGLVLAGCQSAAEHREAADEAAEAIIEQAQEEATGRTEPFSVERPSETFRERLMLEQNLPRIGPETLGVAALEDPEHWPDTGEPAERPMGFMPETAEAAADEPVTMSLIEALQVAANNSRTYQSQKESLFESALQLDLERFAFDTTFRGMLEGLLSTDQSTYQTGVEGTGELGVERQFETGAAVSGRLVVDLVRLLSGERDSSMGILADASVTVPLLRGSGAHIVREPLTQAERNVIYAIHQFERFKRSFVVDVASDYYGVLQQADQIENAEANYQRLVLAARRASRLEDAGQLQRIQVLQAQQDVLRAQQRLISARQSYEQQLDQFKQTLGLPTDARVELVRGELGELREQAETMLAELRIPDADEAGDGEILRADAPVELPEPDPAERGRYEIDEDVAIDLAISHRLDLRTAQAEVYDAQRRVIVAADALRPGLNLVGRAQAGERRGLGQAGLDNARLEPADGQYSLGAELDMPWSRRSERVQFRQSLLRLDEAVRDAQAVEDQVKLDVRSGLRQLLQDREDYRIQVQALVIAQERVRGAELLLEAGRVDIRDVLEAEEALLQAQNALLSSLIGYRTSELGFQRDLGLLEVDHRGLWEEAVLDELELNDGERNARNERENGQG